MFWEEEEIIGTSFIWWFSNKKHTTDLPGTWQKKEKSPSLDHFFSFSYTYNTAIQNNAEQFFFSFFAFFFFFRCLFFSFFFFLFLFVAWIIIIFFIFFFYLQGMTIKSYIYFSLSLSFFFFRRKKSPSSTHECYGEEESLWKRAKLASPSWILLVVFVSIQHSTYVIDENVALKSLILLIYFILFFFSVIVYGTEE